MKIEGKAKEVLLVDFAKIKREAVSFLFFPFLCKKFPHFLSLELIFVLSRKRKFQALLEKDSVCYPAIKFLTKMAIEDQENTIREIKPKNRRIMVFQTYHLSRMLCFTPSKCSVFQTIHFYLECSVFSSKCSVSCT